MSNHQHENAFLRGLEPASFEALNGHLVRVDLVLGASLQSDEAAVAWVYFPLAGLLSLISTVESGQSVETSMVGVEGAAGLIEACGSQTSHVNCVVQVNGRALRAPAAVVRSLALSDQAFNSRAWRFNELQLLEVRQSAICQALHTVEQRCARWLLESQDRSGGRNPLPMTQEFLAAMLGVQRTTVTAYAVRLQQAGAIRYKRGQLEILDRPMLEAKACVCRSLVQKHRHALGFANLEVL